MSPVGAGVTAAQLWSSGPHATVRLPMRNRTFRSAIGALRPSALALAGIGLILVAPTAQAGAGKWTVNGPQGGDIQAIAIDPFNPATIYAGTYAGGIYHSANGAASWAPASRGLRLSIDGLNINDLTFDPSTPGVLYAAVDDGVYKSSDGGRSYRYRYHMARRAIPHTCSAYAASCIRDTRNEPDGVRACMAAKTSCLLTGVHVGPYSGIRYAGMARR